VMRTTVEEDILLLMAVCVCEILCEQVALK
jgi:hypothetical protein